MLASFSKSNRTIRSFYAFARSGGTLTNQILSCCPDLLILSEVAVNESVYTIGWQLHHWHKILAEEEVGLLDRLSYHEQVEHAAALAAKHHKSLCLRDWPVIHFLPGIYSHHQPSGVLESWEYFQSAGWNVKAFAVIRRSYEVYQSLRKYVEVCRNLEEDDFCRYYETYIREINRIGVRKFYMESLWDAPLECAQGMAQTLDVAPPVSIDGFHEYTLCTGNITLPAKPASAQQNTIRRPDKSTHMPPPQAFLELDQLACYE